jgi:hypothetical protein
MLQIIRTWTIRTIKEFEGISNTHTHWALYKNEREKICELDITELRKLKEFFDEWIDPFQTGNPKHNDKLK